MSTTNYLKLSRVKFSYQGLICFLEHKTECLKSLIVNLEFKRKNYLALLFHVCLFVYVCVGLLCAKKVMANPTDNNRF